MPINWQLSRQRVSPLQEILKTFKAFLYHGATDISDIVLYFQFHLEEMASQLVNNRSKRRLLQACAVNLNRKSLILAKKVHIVGLSVYLSI